MTLDELFSIPAEERPLYSAINGLMGLFPEGTYEVLVRHKRTKTIALEATVTVEPPDGGKAA